MTSWIEDLDDSSGMALMLLAGGYPVVGWWLGGSRSARSCFVEQDVWNGQLWAF